VDREGLWRVGWEVLGRFDEGSDKEGVEADKTAKTAQGRAMERRK